MGRQRILYHISIEKRGNTWEDRESYVTSLQRKEEIDGKTENHVLHLYREKRKNMGRQRILYYISIEKRGKTWEDGESCITYLQRKEEKHGKTENPVLHLYREKRKNMGRQRILYYISIEKIENSWEDRESCITSLQRKEEKHGKTENPVLHLYREKWKKHGKTENPVSHLYREKRKYMGRQRILYHISIEKRGNVCEDRESCIISLQRKEEIHGKTDNPMSHLYR